MLSMMMSEYGSSAEFVVTPANTFAAVPLRLQKGPDVGAAPLVKRFVEV